MKTLLLYSSYTDLMSYFDDWVDAFKEHKHFQAECINVMDQDLQAKEVYTRIENAELIIIHHSMNGDTLKYLNPFIESLKNRKGRLVSFVGNELNMTNIGMEPKINNLKELEPNIIATQLLQEAGEWLYKDCVKSEVISLPHALNPKAFFSTAASEHRKIDIGTRSARYGAFLGDQDRNHIIQFFQQNSRHLNLIVDLGLDSTSVKRFNRSQWAEFLSSCKATLSTEAGTFYLERNDQLVNQIQDYMKKSSQKFVLENDSAARQLYRTVVPHVVRKTVAYILRDKIIEADTLGSDANFDEIYKKFFAGVQKCPVYSKAISSRHFDAIGTKTLHVMYPGRYNDILNPGEHYFELKRDHSNIKELTELLKDSKRIQRITDHVYDHVIHNHTYQNRLDTLLQALN